MRRLELVYDGTKKTKVTAAALAAHFPAFSLGSLPMSRSGMLGAVEEFWRGKVLSATGAAGQTKDFREAIVGANLPRLRATPAEIGVGGEWKVFVKVVEDSRRPPVQAFAFTLFIDDPADWGPKVVCSRTRASLNNPALARKIDEVAEDGGRGAHGGYTASVDGKPCLHWACGSNTRIFGYFDAQARLNVVGVGSHTGSKGNVYNVEVYRTGKAVRVTLTG